MKNKIIEWMYANDGKFGSKNEWRKNFIEFLTELEDKQPIKCSAHEQRTAKENILNCKMNSSYCIGFDPANGIDWGHTIIIKPKHFGGKIIYEMTNLWDKKPIGGFVKDFHRVLNDLGKMEMPEVKCKQNFESRQAEGLISDIRKISGCKEGASLLERIKHLTRCEETLERIRVATKYHL
jgi:hypothetical protein